MSKETEDLKEKSVREALSRITIVGVEDARIDDIEQLLTNLSSLGQFQLMDARFILGEDHVRFACFEALRVFDNGQNITVSLPMEILIRAACTTQISEAIERLGVRKGSSDLVLVAIEAGKNGVEAAIALTKGRESSGPLKGGPEKRVRVKKAFSLTEPVERTLLERIALSSVG